MDEIILGENKTFDEVRKDLNFPSQIPGMPITVSWEVDNYEVMNVLGELQTEALRKEGTIVQITGKLRYGDEERIYMRSANVFPPKLKGEQKIAAQLSEQISEEEKAHPEQRQMESFRKLSGESWTVETSGAEQRIYHFSARVYGEHSSYLDGEGDKEGSVKGKAKADAD